MSKNRNEFCFKIGTIFSILAVETISSTEYVNMVSLSTKLNKYN